MNVTTSAVDTGREIAARKARWRAFTEPGADPGFMFFVNYPDPDAPESGLPHPARRDTRLEAAWYAYESQLSRAAIIGDDRVPFTAVWTGTEIFAEAFGCPVERPDDTMPFALPLVSTPAAADALTVPELSTSSLAYLFEMGDELHRRAGGEAVMRMVDIQSPMDIAALIWEKSAFFAAMIDAPESVMHLAAKVHELLTAFLDEWFSRYGREHIAHFPEYFMATGMTLSEDEIGAVNTQMFDDFFRDELIALSARYGGLGVHCCAAARHQWDSLIALPGLRVLNLCNPPAEPLDYTRDAHTYFGERVVHVHHGWSPDCAPADRPRHFPANTRVIHNLDAGDESAASELASRLRDLRDSGDWQQKTD
jgi:hypothetical protein